MSLLMQHVAHAQTGSAIRGGLRMLGRFSELRLLTCIWQAIPLGDHRGQLHQFFLLELLVWVRLLH